MLMMLQALLSHSECEVFGWGLNHIGKIGVGKQHEILRPTLISALEGEKITSIKGGTIFTLFIAENNKVYGCGLNRGLGSDKIKMTHDLK